VSSKTCGATAQQVLVNKRIRRRPMTTRMKKALTLVISSVLLSACAISPNFGESNLVDFNESFQASNVLEPKFRLQQVGSAEYNLVIHQGKPLISEGSTRYFLLEEAAKVIASKFCGGVGSDFVTAKWSKHGDAGWVHLMGSFRCINVPEPKESNQQKRINPA
jgi:hypothetical protein